MTEVVADITVTLDGFVAAPGVDLEHGLGVGGEPIHRWAVEDVTPADQAVLDAAVARTGCVVQGRVLFDIIDGPDGWSDEMSYGRHGLDELPPVVVVTHRAPETWRLGERFRFATDGIEDAIAQARELAGDQDVVIMGGAGVIQSAWNAGLVDLLSLHVAPVVFGDGTRLFDGLPIETTQLERVGDVVATPHATHVTYRVPR